MRFALSTCGVDICSARDDDPEEEVKPDGAVEPGETLGPGETPESSTAPGSEGTVEPPDDGDAPGAATVATGPASNRTATTAARRALIVRRFAP
nr:hypothetical protein [Halorubrum hochsteinianum]